MLLTTLLMRIIFTRYMFCALISTCNKMVFYSSKYQTLIVLFLTPVTKIIKLVSFILFFLCGVVCEQEIELGKILKYYCYFTNKQNFS